MSALDDLVADGTVEEMVGVSDLTTYRVGGRARFFFKAASEEELIAVGSAVRDEPVLVVGKGSNLVISDRGFPGLVVQLGGSFGQVHLDETGVVTAGGAAAMPAVARACSRAGRSGLEFFIGIPGSVGGGVRMNAGCHGVETKDQLRTARVVSIRTGEVSERTAADLDLRYRYSNLRADEIVTAATFLTESGDPDDIARTMREIVRWRRDHQPGGTYNAGSVFKNPPGDSAGRIIDSLGLKGTRVGGAVVSARHANFFVAESGVTAQDVYDLVVLIQRRVAEAVNIHLEPEVRFAGPFEPTDLGEINDDES